MIIPSLSWPSPNETDLCVRSLCAGLSLSCAVPQAVGTGLRALGAIRRRLHKQVRGAVSAGMCMLVGMPNR